MSDEGNSFLHPDEEATVHAFIIKEKKQRYIDMLANSKKRAKIVDDLNHCRDIDERFATPVLWNNAFDELKKRGAPVTCRLISSISGLNEKVLPLAAALPLVEEGGWGTILCCIPGQLAYYFDECGFRRLILDHKHMN